MRTTERLAGLARGGTRLLLVLLLSVPASADTVQRQSIASAVEVSAAGGYRVESHLGAFAVARVTGGDNSVFSGYLNTNHAPATVVDLAAFTSPAESTAQLTWTAPGADGFAGQAASIIVKASTSPITTLALFEAASTYAVLTPLAGGGFETRLVGSVKPGPEYYFAVIARDAAKNQGRLSNLASTHTISIPPAAVSDLAASAGAAAGSASLTWTAPGDDGGSGALAPGEFRIAHSTAAAPSFDVGTYQVLIATLAAAGSAQAVQLTGLQGNALHAFAMFTGDDLPVYSGQSNVATALTRAYVPAALAYSAASSTTFTANWGLNGNRSGTEFFAEVSDSADFSGILGSSGWTTSLSAGFGGLQAETTYYARVKARNSAGFETAFADLGELLLNTGLAAPIGIIVSTGDARVSLSWNPVLSGTPDGVRIFRATAATGPFTAVASYPLSTVAHDDTGLVNGTTYWFAMASFRGGSQSPLSAAFPAVPRDGLRPQGLALIEGMLNGPAFDMTWGPNPWNADGSAMTDLAGYRVYRSTSHDGASALVATLPAGASVSYSDPAGAAFSPAWYFVRAFDTSGNESIDSPWVRSTVTREVNLVSPDRMAFLAMSPSAAARLAETGVVVLFERRPQEETGRVAVAYEVKAVESRTAKTADSILESGNSTLAFRFHTASGLAGMALRPGAVYKPEDLAVFFHNGVEYVKLGGEVDFPGRTISVRSRASGRYIVKQSVRAENFTLIQTTPRRVFTPNADGVNDVFTIFFDNPADSVISHAKVYDLTGAEVADLKLGAAGDSLAWDGRNRGGGYVSGGVYIYQIQAEGRTMNGTMVVAR